MPSLELMNLSDYYCVHILSLSVYRNLASLVLSFMAINLDRLGHAPLFWKIMSSSIYKVF